MCVCVCTYISVSIFPFTGISITPSVQMKFICEFIKVKMVHYVKIMQLLMKLSRLKVWIQILIRNISIVITANTKAVSEHIVPLEICVLI